MPEKIPLFDWHNALNQTFQELSKQIVGYIPQLLGALLLLLIGWGVAYLLRTLTQKLLHGLDALFTRIAQKKGLHVVTVSSYGYAISNVVFWAVLLFFFAASANLLEWKLFASVTKALITYLPSLLAGLLIILSGFALSGLMRTAVVSTAVSTGVAHAGLLGRIAQVTFVLTTFVIGVEQMGIDVGFLTSIVMIVIGVLLAGASLAFGLGARQLIANVIGAQSARSTFKIGQYLSLDGVDGRLLEISTTTLLVDTARGRTLIPASRIHEIVSEIITEGPDSDTSSNTAGS